MMKYCSCLSTAPLAKKQTQKPIHYFRLTNELEVARTYPYMTEVFPIMLLTGSLDFRDPLLSLKLPVRFS